VLADSRAGGCGGRIRRECRSGPAADWGARQIRHADVAVVRFSADHATGKAAPGGANAGRSNWVYWGLVSRPDWR
jgi:hypothetical protein